MRKFQPYSFGYCSGWMAIRGAKRRRAADRGFVLSDHADWNGLISAIDATGCESVYLTHGYTATFARYLSGIGFDAHEVHTLYGGEEDAPTQPPPEVEEFKETKEEVFQVSPTGGDLEGAGEARGTIS
jgi:putative mRNA 3-end processing factor